MINDAGAYYADIIVPDHFTGTVHIFYQVWDPSGNTMLGALLDVHVIDGIAPIIAEIGDINVTAGDLIEVYLGVSDNIAVVAFSWTGSPLDTTWGSLVGIIDTPGRYVVILTFHDEAGNTATGNFTITVNDVPTDDEDGDGISDEWEKANSLDSSDPSDAGLDPDGDERTNLVEYLMDSDPNVEDKEWSDKDEEGVSYLIPAIILLIIVILEAAVLGFILLRKGEEPPSPDGEEGGDQLPEPEEMDGPEMDELSEIEEAIEDLEAMGDEELNP